MNTAQDKVYKHKYLKQANTSRQWWVLRGILSMVDLACVIGALMLSYVLRIDGVLDYYPQSNIDAYTRLMLVATPTFLLCFWLVGLYKPDNLLGGVVEYKQIAKGCTAGVMLIVAYTVFVREENFDVSRLWLVMSWVFSIVLIVIMRFSVRRLVYYLRHQYGWLASRVLIVGANDQGVAIAEQWMRTPVSGMHVVGFLDDFKTIGTTVTGKLKVIGRPSALDQISREVSADEIVVVSTAVAWESFGEIVTANGTDKKYTLRLSPGFYDLLTTGVAVTNKTFVPLLTIHENRIVGMDALLKWLFDYAIGMLIALPAAPIGFAIWLVLKLNNPHMPAVIRAPVIGQGGKQFRMLRFNTSVIGESGERIKPRRFQRFLRITGLHKLPQLCNVLAGQMSVVGPRPRRAVNNVTDMHTIHNLLALKPGVVGPWMRRDHLRSPDLQLDELNYVRNWQIWLDVSILFQALAVIPARVARGIRYASVASVTEAWSTWHPAQLKEDVLR